VDKINAAFAKASEWCKAHPRAVLVMAGAVAGVIVGAVLF